MVSTNTIPIVFIIKLQLFSIKYFKSIALRKILSFLCYGNIKSDYI